MVNWRARVYYTITKPKGQQMKLVEDCKQLNQPFS